MCSMSQTKRGLIIVFGMLLILFGFCIWVLGYGLAQGERGLQRGILFVGAIPAGIGGLVIAGTLAGEMREARQARLMDDPSLATASPNGLYRFVGIAAIATLAFALLFFVAR